MRPSVVVLGFVLGSAAAISFALTGTSIVFFALRHDYPRLEAELVPLLRSVTLFLLLTAAAAGSFYGELRVRRWRGLAHAALVLMLAAVAAYHAGLRD